MLLPNQQKIDSSFNDMTEDAITIATSRTLQLCWPCYNCSKILRNNGALYQLECRIHRIQFCTYTMACQWHETSRRTVPHRLQALKFHDSHAHADLVVGPPESVGENLHERGI